MELNREQIIEALECCKFDAQCDDCPYVGKCWNLNKDAATLIKKLFEDYENLKAENDELRMLVNALNKNNAELEDELAQTYNLIEESKYNTVKKMQSIIKENCIKGGIYPVLVDNVIKKVGQMLLEEEE